MRRKFSEKYGFKIPRESFQVESIDNALKNRLWNTVKTYYLDPLITYHGDTDDRFEFKYVRDDEFFKKLYDEFFKTHEVPSTTKYQVISALKVKYFDLRWFEIYDLVEYLPEIFYDADINTGYRTQINTVLEAEMSAYRFVAEYITPIIAEAEIAEIEEVMQSEYSAVNRHISNSLELLSDRESPDYINSIKESISAVESMCQIYNGNNSALGSCLNQLTFDLNPSFKQGMTKLYNWTSQEDGIRHGHTGDEIVSGFDEAKYMLVTCSAFVNYLISKHSNS